MPQTKKIDDQVTEQDLDPVYLTFTDREKMFVDEYLKVFDKTKAARKAGYAASCAASTGVIIYNRKPVYDYIQERIRLTHSSLTERMRKLDNIANTSMSDYMKPVEREVQTWIEIPMRDYIKRLRVEADIEQEYADWLESENLFDDEPDEAGVNEARRKVKAIEKQISKIEMQLRRFPNLTKTVEGPKAIEIDYVLDMKKLLKNKDKVQIKSVKLGPKGLEIEPYSALDAHDKLIRLKGDYAKDNEQKKPEATVNLNGVPDDVIKQLLDANKPTK